MRLSTLLVSGVFAVACGSKTEGGINATVDFTRVDRGRACIRIAVIDLASVGSQPERFEANNIDISDMELTGEIGVGIGRNPEWTDGVEVRASLHRDTCARVPEAIDTGRATFRLNEVQKIRLSLRQSALDGGSGGGEAGGSAGGGSVAGGSAAGGAAGGGSAAGGSAAGGSAAGGSAAGGSAAGGSAAGGSAAGGSAAGGSAAGGSAAGGSAAGGSAAGGSAAGGSAAGGSAAGGSAAGGSAACPANATPRYFTIGSDTWNDLTPYANGFILAGEKGSIARFNPADGGSTDVGGGTCAGRDYFGVSVRPIDQAVFLTTGTGSLIRWLGPGQCAGVNAVTAGFGTAVRAFDNALFVGSFDGPGINSAGSVNLTRLLPDGGAPSTQPVNGAGQVWEFSGPSSNALFAAGWEHAVQRRGRIWEYDPGAGSWSTALSGSNDTPIYAIDVPSPMLGFAAGQAFYEWNGTVWSAARVPPPLQVFGLKVFSSTEVYAVGTDTQSRAAVALWDGNSWTLIGPAVRPSGSITRVRGASRCTLLGVGSGGNAMTTLP